MKTIAHGLALLLLVPAASATAQDARIGKPVWIGRLSPLSPYAPPFMQERATLEQAIGLTVPLPVLSGADRMIE